MKHTPNIYIIPIKKDYIGPCIVTGNVKTTAELSQANAWVIR